MSHVQPQTNPWQLERNHPNWTKLGFFQQRKGKHVLSRQPACCKSNKSSRNHHHYSIIYSSQPSLGSNSSVFSLFKPKWVHSPLDYYPYVISYSLHIVGQFLFKIFLNLCQLYVSTEQISEIEKSLLLLVWETTIINTSEYILPLDLFSIYVCLFLWYKFSWLF